jgi:Fur family peroxide stress response transcriptional regulator
MKSVEQVLQKLRDRGMKCTPQRIEVLRLLEGDTSHPSAEELYRRARKRFSTLSLATVYNTLHWLHDSGEVRTLKPGTEPTRYDPRTEPHDHFYCVNCGHVIDIETDSDSVGVIGGHLVRSRHIHYRGVCAACRGSSSR